MLEYWYKRLFRANFDEMITPTVISSVLLLCSFTGSTFLLLHPSLCRDFPKHRNTPCSQNCLFSEETGSPYFCFESRYLISLLRKLILHSSSKVSRILLFSSGMIFSSNTQKLSDYLKDFHQDKPLILRQLHPADV